MGAAGLHLVSAHYSSDDLHQKLDEIIAFNKELGVSYIICSFPGFKDPSRVAGLTPKQRPSPSLWKTGDGMRSSSIPSARK